MAQSVVQGCQQALVFRKVVGGFSQELRKGCDALAGRRFHDHAVSGRPRVSPRATVHVRHDFR